MALDAAGELRRIKTPVDPVLEIAEITDRVSKSATREGLYPGSGGGGGGGDNNSGPPFSGKAPRHGTAAVNQALLFENVQGSSMPVAINTFGSYNA